MWTEKILSHDSGNVRVYVGLHDTVAATRLHKVSNIMSQRVLHLKEVSIFDIAEVLNLDLPLHCSIKIS